ncbi:MAG: ABC transporter substrate-binding protein [Novosphingobium sp.]|nr:ABC transporter substrate-binding protein [Novosphingobium sp.]
MVLRKQFWRFAVAAIAAFLVNACGSSGDSQVKVVVIGEPDDPFESGVRLSAAGQLVRAATVEGLVAFDEQGRIVPALADRWIVTDDGQSYIFRLRDGTWRDGSELNAKVAARSLRSAIEALRGTPLGLDLASVDEVREMAGRVVEIRLSHPAPYLLQLLAQPEMGLTHGGSGGGPMRLEREGEVAMLTPIPPVELGLPDISHWDDRARAVSLSAAGGKEAVDRFNEGEADLVLGGRISTFPYTSSVGILRGTIQLDPVEGLFGLQVMSSRGFLSDETNREALALAIDRDALIAPFGVAGWTARADIAASLPADAQGGPDAAGSQGQARWAGLSLAQRRANAKARVATWRQGRNGGDGAPALSVWLPAGPGSDLLFTRLKQDFASIGVELSRAKKDETGDLRLLDVVARYPRPVWYYNRFNCTMSKNACSPEADGALAAALKASDPAARAELIRKARDVLTEANIFIPFGSPIRWSLVRGDATGFAANAWGWHPLMPMAMRPK